MVARLQELGLELARIRELMTPRRAEATHTERMAGLRCALTEQRGLIEARMNTLAEQHESLGRALEKLAECERCTHTPSSENNFCHPCQVDGKELPVDLSARF
jgi:DNA-binding transcriptional MerR regulator